jgi:hypothetical protein
VTSVPVRAQGAAEDPTTDMARARFKEGVGYYDKGQFEQARAAFLQAYALKKHPAVLLNLAWSCLKSGHTLEAQRYFKQFLAEGRDATDKQRADATDGLTQSNAKLGRIDVAAAAGTEVTIDGDKAGTTPLADPIMVEPGAHTVRFKGPDGTTDTDSVTVLAGEKAIARFSKTASAAPAAAKPTAPTTGTDTDTTPPPAPPPDETPKTAEPPTPKDTANVTSHRSLLSPPDTIAPVIVGGVVVVGSAAVAIIMLTEKQTAQNKANNTASQIAGVGGTSCSPPGITPAAAAQAKANKVDLLGEVTNACAQYQADNKDVNTDATIGNIALGVSVVAAVGTVVYWLVADRKDTSAPTASTRPVLTPIIGTSVGGLTLSGSF